MNFRYCRRCIFSVTLLALLFLISTQSFADDERYLKINRSIELFGRVYQEIVNNYVDDIDPEKFMRAGIDGMLDALDPYTVYIDERGRDEVDLLTTGRYGGVGLSIGRRNGHVTVTSLTEGYVAEKEGLMIGDRITAVDRISVNDKSLADIRSAVRGEPGSEVTITVERESYDKPLAFTLTRESIRVENVRYADFIDDGIVYVKLARFSRGAGGETRQTLRDLQRQNTINGVILDLRDNSGGLLDAAVEVTNIFVPRGTLIVSTRGRTSDSVRRYVASQEPVLPDVPLVVLINENSASASEIVAGAIQDKDRGVLVGTRSFGKGLVQTVANLRSDAQLKITTSRYYTPSGRSIQTSDYLDKAPEGLFYIDDDSLRAEYKTSAGRLVQEGKGIAPDTVITLPERSRYLEQLEDKAMIFSFATKFIHTQANKDAEPIVDDGLLDSFKEFLQEREFTYQGTSEKKLEDLREIAKIENYSEKFFKDLDEIQVYITEDKQHAFTRHRDEIQRELITEFALRYSGERGKIKKELEYDKQFIVAVDLLKDKPLYQHQLTTVD